MVGESLLTGTIKCGNSCVPERLAGQPDADAPDADATGKTFVVVMVANVVGTGAAAGVDASLGVVTMAPTLSGCTAGEEVATGATTAAGLEALLDAFSAVLEAALDAFSPAVEGVPSLPAPAALIDTAPAVAVA